MCRCDGAPTPAAEPAREKGTPIAAIRHSTLACLWKLKRAKLVLEIRDLQPESSEDFGNLNRSLFTRSLKKLKSGSHFRISCLDFTMKVRLP